MGASNQTKGEREILHCENPSSASRGPDFQDSTQDMGENEVVTELRARPLYSRTHKVVYIQTNVPK